MYFVLGKLMGLRQRGWFAVIVIVVESGQFMAMRTLAKRVFINGRPKTALKWTAAVAVGLAAVTVRPAIVSRSTGLLSAGHWHSSYWTGDIRTLAAQTQRRFLTNSIPRFSIFSSFTSSLPKMSLTPPQPPPVWNHSAEDIVRYTKEAIEKDRAVQDAVGKLDPKDCTFESVREHRLSLLGFIPDHSLGLCEYTKHPRSF